MSPNTAKIRRHVRQSKCLHDKMTALRHVQEDLGVQPHLPANGYCHYPAAIPCVPEISTQSMYVGGRPMLYPSMQHAKLHHGTTYEFYDPSTEFRPSNDSQQTHMRDKFLRKLQVENEAYERDIPASTQYLDETKSFIWKIVESQNSGKLSECVENQERLQRNLVYLAVIADSRSQPSTIHPQIPSSGIRQPGGGHYMRHQQAQQMMQQSLMTARSSMLYAQQPFSALQQQQALHQPSLVLQVANTNMNLEDKVLPLEEGLETLGRRSTILLKEICCG
ncbi:hypothetical protein V6N12_055542 [Hibiscus sabdariffa]|uniref:SS18 N-terminal domain-containing protein n=1 Tax=Hibiscus sabdariffa TaxID=183260 RepID=A0ABR2BTZ8_9ROSI